MQRIPKRMQVKNDFRKTTRREFLKNVGIFVGGMTVGSISMLNACKSSEDKTDEITPTIQPLKTKEFWELVSTKTSAMGMPIYEDPTLSYAYIVAPGCVSRIPIDRQYGLEHCWVSVQSKSLVRIGITDYFQMYLGWVLFIDLPGIGSKIDPGSFFGSTEGRKMNMDVISPIGGKVLKINNELATNPGLLNIDPYGLGWLVEIQPNNLDADSKNLLSPDDYAQRTAKTINPDEPVPLLIP